MEYDPCDITDPFGYPCVPPDDNSISKTDDRIEMKKYKKILKNMFFNLINISSSGDNILIIDIPTRSSKKKRIVIEKKEDTFMVNYDIVEKKNLIENVSMAALKLCH